MTMRFFIGEASATQGGILTTSAQTIAGIKTFSSPPVMSGASITAASIPDAALSSNVPLKNASNTFSAAQLIGGSSLAQPLNLFRDLTAGASTNSVQLVLGNGNSAQGNMRLTYTNAAATGAPVAQIGFFPRNNADSTAVNPGNLTFTKTAGADTCQVDLSGSNSGKITITAAGALTFTGAGNFATSMTVGGGTALTKTMVYSQTITPASVAANTTAEQTFTVTGLTTADKVTLNPGAAPTAGTGIVGVRVSAADTLAVTYSNNTAGSLTPVSSTCLILATRS